MTTRTKNIAKLFLPPGTRRFEFAKVWAIRFRLLNPPPPDRQYADWVERTEPFLWSETIVLEHQPLISIVVPVFNTPARYLMPMVYSIVNQSYPNWELVMVNASTTDQAIELTEDCAKIDTRIKVIDVEDNLGIAGNTNLGLAHASGEYVGLLDHDDTLAPQSLYEVARLLQTPGQNPQLVYSDEDKITEDGEYRFGAFFKPDWSPQIMRHVNYINHFTVIEKALIDEVGRYRTGFEGAQDYDLFLRLIDKQPRIAHIPRMLYHWRAAHSSTASNFAAKRDIIKAGVSALSEHLRRNGQKGKVRSLDDSPGFYCINYEPKRETKAAILLLPGRNQEKYSGLSAHLLKGLKGASPSVDIFLTPNGRRLRPPNKKITLKEMRPTGTPQFITKALGQTDANILIFINSAVLSKRSGWVKEICGILDQNQNLGIMAPILTEPGNEGIRDAGFANSGNKIVGLFQGVPLKAFTYFGNAVWGRNVDYLSGRVCAMRREIYEKYFEGKRFYNGAENYDPQPFKELLADSLQVAVFPQIQMEDYGELTPGNPKTRFFSPSLGVRYETRLVRDFNLYLPEDK